MKNRLKISIITLLAMLGSVWAMEQPYDTPVVEMSPQTVTLFGACLIGNVQEAQFSIESGADVNATTQYDGKSPLHIAAENGNLPLVRLLVNSGAHWNAITNSKKATNGRVYKGKTALELAEAKKHKHIVDFLTGPTLEPVFPKKRNRDDIVQAQSVVEVEAMPSPLPERKGMGFKKLFAQKFEEEGPVIRIVKPKKKPVTDFEDVMLYDSMDENREALVATYDQINQSESDNNDDSVQFMPSCEASNMGQKSEEVMNFDLSPERSEQQSIFADSEDVIFYDSIDEDRDALVATYNQLNQSESDDNDNVRLAPAQRMPKVSVDARKPEKITSFDLSSKRSDERVGFSQSGIIYCLATNKLYNAVLHNQVDVVEQLIKSGIDIDYMFPEGKNSLHIAAERGNLDMVKLLLIYGADSDAKTHDDKTARTLAANNKHNKVVSCIRKFKSQELDSNYLIDEEREVRKSAQTRKEEHGYYSGSSVNLLKPGAQKNNPKKKKNAQKRNRPSEVIAEQQNEQVNWASREDLMALQASLTTFTHRLNEYERMLSENNNNAIEIDDEPRAGKQPMQVPVARMRPKRMCVSISSGDLNDEMMDSENSLKSDEEDL